MSQVHNIASTLPVPLERGLTRQDVPLMWWRGGDVGDLGPRHAARLSRLLAQVAEHLPDDWSIALNGGAADAIAADRDLGFSESESPLVRDLVGSALLRHAMAGSAEATQVLGYMRYFHHDVVTWKAS